MNQLLEEDVKPIPSYKWDNKWPLLLWLIGTIFYTGFTYAQFQEVIKNQERFFATQDKIEGRLGTIELNNHSLFATLKPVYPQLTELQYSDNSGILQK